MEKKCIAKWLQKCNNSKRDRLQKNYNLNFTK